MVNERVFKSSISNDANAATIIFHPAHTKKALLDGILICNKTSTDATVSIAIREKHKELGGTDGLDFFIAKDTSVPANTTIEMIEGSYPMQHPGPGNTHHDQLIAYASASNAIDIIVAIKNDVN